MKLTVAVISPHPDDAALSIGALLGCLHDAEIVLLTCFSESCTLSRADAPATTRLRYAEDEAYAKHIGAGLVSLRLPDTSIRTNHGIEELCPDAEKLLYKELLNRLDLALRESRASSIFAPLAVGGHWDHIHCRESAIAGCDDRLLFFYEDLPYADFEGGPSNVEQAIRIRFPGLRSLCIPFSGTEMRSKLRGLGLYSSQIHPDWKAAVERYASTMRPADGVLYGERLWFYSPAEDRLNSLLEHLSSEPKGVGSHSAPFGRTLISLMTSSERR